MKTLAEIHAGTIDKLNSRIRALEYRIAVSEKLNALYLQTLSERIENEEPEKPAGGVVLDSVEPIAHHKVEPKFPESFTLKEFARNAFNA
jgi:hypothetical protein